MSYSDSFTVDPSTFVCNTYGHTRICGGATAFANFRILNATDTLQEDITYTHPLLVPGSAKQDVAYVTLFDDMITNGPAQPGPDVAAVSSVPIGYAGPANPGTAFTAGFLHEYVAALGFGPAFGGVPNNGFSLSGINSTFNIVAGDPNFILGVSYGYQVVLPEPATFAVMGGALAGLIFGRRKRRAQS